MRYKYIFLTEEQRLDSPITMNKIEEGRDLITSTMSPGPDGFTAEFLSAILLECLHYCLTCISGGFYTCVDTIRRLDNIMWAMADLNSNFTGRGRSF